MNTQSLPSRRGSKIVARRSGIHGRGVFATEAIPWGTRLIEYKGEIIDVDESLRRYPGTHTFIFMLDKDRMIDGGAKGNSARWVNHCCTPNCDVVYEGDRIYFDTLRHINKGEEITIDYNFEVRGARYTESLLREYACKCGSPRCRGTYLSPKDGVADTGPSAPVITERSGPEYLNLRRRYWEDLAPAYDETVFDVLRNDRGKVLLTAIGSLASRGKSVSDFGCAVGKWLPHLAARFGKVFAIDVAARNLDIAQQRCAEFANIRYLRADLSRKDVALPRTDVGICINAVLTPSMRHRELFFENLGRGIKRGGSLVLGVPSLESAMFCAQLAARWKLDSGLPKTKVGPVRALRKWINLQQGNVEIGDVPHKHYLREELELQLKRVGFEVTAVQKVEYPWHTEFVDPPAWLNRPGPWSWAVVARRR